MNRIEEDALLAHRQVPAQRLVAHGRALEHELVEVRVARVLVPSCSGEEKLRVVHLVEIDLLDDSLTGGPTVAQAHAVARAAAHAHPFLNDRVEHSILVHQQQLLASLVRGRRRPGHRIRPRVDREFNALLGLIVDLDGNGVVGSDLDDGHKVVARLHARAHAARVREPRADQDREDLLGLAGRLPAHVDGDYGCRRAGQRRLGRAPWEPAIVEQHALQPRLTVLLARSEIAYNLQVERGDELDITAVGQRARV